MEFVVILTDFIWSIMASKPKQSSINTKDGASMVASVDKANPAGKQAAASGLGDQQQSAAYHREIVFEHKRQREGPGQ